MNVLTVALAQLRRDAPGAIEAARRRTWSQIGVDVHDLLSDLEARQWTRGIEAYGGPFLHGEHLHDLGGEAGIDLDDRPAAISTRPGPTWLPVGSNRLVTITRRSPYGQASKRSGGTESWAEADTSALVAALAERLDEVARREREALAARELA